MYIFTKHEMPLFKIVETVKREIMPILLDAVKKIEHEEYYGWPVGKDFEDEKTILLYLNTTDLIPEAMEGLGVESLQDHDIIWDDDEDSETNTDEDPAVWAIRLKNCPEPAKKLFRKLWKCKPHSR